ncbi:hypothetical protein D9Q98_001344 [Chlorella vulgaris]|uniref:WD repeat-containing 74 n=1 Tax=Chlorella vulgaris TaxID=3077 RepID=A0A9D4U0I3_CHLVU|nr:hypothetical protein D9Q98_001344 [Chlorella vulgaris]
MDDRTPPLRLLCSDELGQLKVVQTADGTQLGTAALAATWGQPDKLKWIDCIALGSAGGIEDIETAVLAVSRRNGSIELLSAISGQLVATIPAVAAGSDSQQPSPPQQGEEQADAVRVHGLHLLWDNEAMGSLPAVLSVTQGGIARLHSPAGGSWEQQRSWQVPDKVCCTAYDPASSRLAVGCQGTELRLFDVTTGELVFAFKGGKPNKVGLVDRPWNTAITFLPAASTADGTGSSGPGDRLLVGTGHHKVRLYDKEIGKRPQMDLAWGEGRITCMALEPSGERCWLGNGLGSIEVLDLAAKRFTGAVKGLAGAVRALAVHPEAPVLASVGLDRYMRLHSTASRKLLAKVYCKTLPTGLAVCPTDASMLPALEQTEEEQVRRKSGRRAASEEQGFEDAEEAEAPRRQKRSQQRSEGSSRKQTDKRQRRQQAADSD